MMRSWRLPMLVAAWVILIGAGVARRPRQAQARFVPSQLETGRAKTLLNIGIVRAFGKQDLKGAAEIWQKVLVVGIVYLVVTLLADILYAVLDPGVERMRISSAGLPAAVRRATWKSVTGSVDPSLSQRTAIAGLVGAWVVREAVEAFPGDQEHDGDRGGDRGCLEQVADRGHDHAVDLTGVEAGSLERARTCTMAGVLRRIRCRLTMHSRLFSLFGQALMQGLLRFAADPG